jgi:hypothetical protein
MATPAAACTALGVDAQLRRRFQDLSLEFGHTAQRRRVQQHAEHAVEHALLGGVGVMLCQAGCQRAAQQFAISARP